MPSSPDTAYYRRRAAQERRFARHALDPAARLAHETLAHRYDALAEAAHDADLLTPALSLA